MNTLTLDCNIKRNPLVNHMIVDNELIIMGPDDHVAYRINPVGAVLWSLLKTHMLTIEHLANHLQQHYHIDFDQSIRDVKAFVTKMFTKNILLIEQPTPI